MKTSIKTISLLASAALFTLSSLSAVETDPVGYTTVTIKGGNSISLVGIELLKAPEFTGAVTGAGASTLTVEGSDFDALLDAETSYFIDVVSGDNAGVNARLLSWSGDTLTLSDNLSPAIVVNSDIVEIIPLPTLSELFGVSGEVIEGGTALSADLILMSSPESEGLVRVFYSNGNFLDPTPGWRQVGDSGDKGNLPIYFSDGLFVFKKSAGDVDLVLSGEVKMTSSSVVLEDGYLPYSTIFPSGTTLGNSGLFDSENPENSLAGGTVFTADLILLDSDGDGQTERYFYSSGNFLDPTPGWRQVGASGDKSGVPLPSAFAVFNRNGAVSVARSPAY